MAYSIADFHEFIEFSKNPRLLSMLILLDNLQSFSSFVIFEGVGVPRLYSYEKRTFGGVLKGHAMSPASRCQCRTGQ